MLLVPDKRVSIRKPSKKELSIISSLLTIAKSIECTQKVAACAVGTKVLATGTNSYKTHPLSVDARYNALHAEVDLVTNIRDLKNLTVYVARLRVRGPGLAKPCKNCEEILRKAGCQDVSFVVSQGWKDYEENPLIADLKL